MGGKPVLVEIVFRSALGKSTSDQDQGDAPSAEDTNEARRIAREEALIKLRELGFEIGPASSYGVSIQGPAELVKRIFGEGELEVPPSLSHLVEDAYLPTPGEFF